MKAEELRIGNYIDYGHGREPIQVTGKDLSDGIEGRPFRQIKITEDWLLKFGFEKRSIEFNNIGPDNHQCYEIFLSCPFTYDNYLRCNAKLNRWCIIQKVHETNEELDWCEILFSCESVHRLQNLYFALTGSELTLKP